VRFLAQRAPFLLWCLAAFGQDLPLGCAPSKPVAEAGDAVQVEAWAPPGHWTLTWSTPVGQLSSHDRTAVWDLTDVEVGTHNITVDAERSDGRRLSCTARVFVENHFGGRGDLITRRFLLLRGTNPGTKYGLYSYVLLTPDGGNEAAKQWNRSVLDSWLRKVLPVTALERKESTTGLNATFVPVDAVPADEPDLDWVLKHFDYQRSDQLLRALVGAHTHGPYLVSAMSPLQVKYQGRLLVLDASWAPPSTIQFWMDQFVNQAGQERFDQPRAFDLFNLKLRTAIGVLAEGLPQAREALASILTISK
jgi:hypothetical protein